MRQSTFDNMGLEPTIPILSHPDDQVRCEDTGEWHQRISCYRSVDGKYWADLGERLDHETHLVREVLESIIEWSDEYHASDECGGEYEYMVFESIHPMRDNIREAIEELDEYNDSIKLTTEFLNSVCEGLKDHIEFGTTRGYYGSCPHDICFDSFDWGEVEEQVDLSAFPILEELHKRGGIEEVFDELDHEFYIYRSSRAIYDGNKFVRHEYGPYVQSDGITLTNSTDLWYWFGCTEQALIEVYTKCLAVV